MPVQKFFGKWERTSSASRSHRFIPRLEEFEPRIVPYSATGNMWPNAHLVTISFEPDGTNLGGVYSNMVATMNAKFGSAAVWQTQILKAAQVWAAQTNINLAVVPDSGAPSGSGNYEQGDPTMGDIRIGGYNFGSASNALAAAEFPPQANNYSVAGDIIFNTGQTWNIGSNYDLFSVAMHEMGHAFGLGESSTYGAAMYGTYLGAKTGLTSDDISGIRSIYSGGNARALDVYNGTNSSFASAANITPQINALSGTALLTNLNISSAGSAGSAEYFQLTAPAGCSSTMTVTVQSQGLSLLAPNLTVYNASQTQIASVSGAKQYGATLTATLSGITAGETYYIKVAGSENSALGSGAYDLSLNLGSGASPAITLLTTTTPNGSPLHATGSLAQNAPQPQSHGGGGLLGGLLGLVGDVVGVLGLGALLGQPNNHQGIFGGVGDLMTATASSNAEESNPQNPQTVGALVAASAVVAASSPAQPQAQTSVAPAVPIVNWNSATTPTNQAVTSASTFATPPSSDSNFPQTSAWVDQPFDSEAIDAFFADATWTRGVA